MTDRIGQQLGSYQLVRLLGRGGFAEVYLGEHIYLESHAAIKVLHTTLSDEHKDDFLIEAKRLVRLRHRHIIRLLEFGIAADVPFLVMEYASNGSLRLKHPKSSPIPLEIIVVYVKQIASALQYIHEQKLVHRDVKPENMLMGSNSEVLLSDLGIAAVAHTTGSAVLQGQAGTAPYMAPEQIIKMPRPASDQYALGIVTYEWLSGTLPFQGTPLSIINQHLHTPPPSLLNRLPMISPTVESVVLRALAKDPKERFASVSAFADALEQVYQAEVTLQPRSASLSLQPSTSPVSIPLTEMSALASPPVGTEFAPPPQYASANAPPFYEEKVRPRKRRLGPFALLLLALVLLVGGGIVWFVIPHTSGSSSLLGQQAPVYPNVAGVYSGTLNNTTVGIASKMHLSIQQNQGNISGQFTVGLPLVGNGPFTGHIDTTRHIEFTVQGFEGNAPLFFSGLVQSHGSMAGNYCSLETNSQCSPQAGSSGKWVVSKG